MLVYSTIKEAECYLEQQSNESTKPHTTNIHTSFRKQDYAKSMFSRSQKLKPGIKHQILLILIIIYYL